MADVIVTVLGEVDPRNVGRTLTHEHMFLDYTDFYVDPPSELVKYLEGEISLENVGFVQRYPYSNKSNISFFTDDLKEAVLKDISIFREFGGSAIVENTSRGLGRNLDFLKKAAEETGIHVIAGTGFYVASIQPAGVLAQSVENLYKIMKTDLFSGCPEKPDVKCGVIGEVASTYPIHPFEAKVIEATGILQEQVKCPVTFHPGWDKAAPFEIMRLYTEAGGNSGQAVMSHLDRTLKTSDLLDFAQEYKCFLQQDLFGTEVLTYQFSPKFQMPCDAQRLKRVKLLIENGFSERILMSHDIHTKHRLVQYGGHGYSHLLCNVLPKMKDIGISVDDIDKIMIENPRNWLSWHP